MTEESIACSLEAQSLQQRLQEIGAIGFAALIDAQGPTEGARRTQRHMLRFRPEEGIRDRLYAVIAAEAQCCPFLQLSLEEAADALVLTIAAPAEAGAIAGELARTFERGTS